MKQFLLATAFLLFTFVGFGQCPQENIFLGTQQDVDDFAVNYPGCTNILINLYIGEEVENLHGLSQITSINIAFHLQGTSITNFQGMENLVNIGVEFFVFSNDNLQSFIGLESLTEVNSFKMNYNPIITNFEGLESLATIDEFLIQDNDGLTNFQGLESLTTVNTDFNVSLNPMLTSIEGLENLEFVGEGLRFLYQQIPSFAGFSNLEYIGNRLVIVDNDVIENLEGFENVTSLSQRLVIENCENLSSIQGLGNITSIVSEGIRIKRNPNLSMCNIEIVCANLNTQNLLFFDIEENAPGCNSVTEVEFQCEIVTISDNNFLNALLNYTPAIDTNSDGNIQFDEAEAFTGTLNVANKIIADFTGLEAFVNSTGFNGSGNFMGALSLEANTVLTSVDFSNSPDLETVNLKNGNNTAITSFNGVGCPSLQFICVDDVAFAEANFTNIDAQVVFVEDCEILAVSDFNLAENISIFPNPVSDILTISTTENFSLIKAEIYSIGGQKLKETAATQIDMSDLSAGIYFVNVVTDAGSSTKKIVKQ